MENCYDFEALSSKTLHKLFCHTLTNSCRHSHTDGSDLPERGADLNIRGNLVFAERQSDREIEPPTL